MTHQTASKTQLQRLQVQVRKAKAAIRREEHSQALATHAAALGCPLSANDVGYIKNHIPPHITRVIVEAIIQAGDRTKRRGIEGEAKARQRAAKRAAGLVQTTVWVRPENIAKVQAIAEDTAPTESIRDDRATLRTAIRAVHMEKAGLATDAPERMPTLLLQNPLQG